jgi:hypothetical protein
MVSSCYQRHTHQTYTFCTSSHITPSCVRGSCTLFCVHPPSFCCARHAHPSSVRMSWQVAAKFRALVLMCPLCKITCACKCFHLRCEARRLRPMSALATEVGSALFLRKLTATLEPIFKTWKSRVKTSLRQATARYVRHGVHVLRCMLKRTHVHFVIVRAKTNCTMLCHAATHKSTCNRSALST